MKAALVLLSMLVAASASAAPQPLVRVKIDAEQPVLVGQQVRVDVTVLAPNFFLSPPQFPTLSIPGAMANLLDERALNSTETIDGVSYAGITKSYAVTPQQPGELRLPPAEIAFTYAAEPGQPAVPAKVALPAEVIRARLAPGQEAGSAPVAKLAITQKLDRATKGLRAGDALTRTIEIFAPNTQAMMIPPPELTAPDGVKMYRRDPQLWEVKDERGGAGGGRRVERVTYAFERAGHFILPPVEIGWIDAATGKREVSRVEAIDVNVAAAAAPGPLAPERPRQSLRLDWRHVALLGAGLMVLLVGAWVALRLGPPIEQWWTARQVAMQQSEKAHFERLTHACEVNDAAAAQAALALWAHDGGFSSLCQLAESDARLAAEIAVLEHALYAPSAPTPWNGSSLATAGAKARARRARQRSQRPPRGRSLPSLNP